MADYSTTYRERLAHEINPTPAEYLPWLLQLVRLFRLSVMLEPAQDSFRQGWREAVTGETPLIDELWTDMDE